MKKILILFIISLSLSSCGTFRINKTSDFGKIKDMSELNGKYRNEDTLQRKEYRLQMLQLVGCLECLDEDIKTAIAIRNSIDSVTIQFPDNNTLLVSFSANGTVLSRELKGKKKRKYFEIYSHKEQFIIPLIYGHVSVGRLRIGRYKKTNDLLIRNLSEQMG